ncbi:MAG: KOW domain-containing RNA-binding protein [Oscillospiraceae bacterium]|nr:KOW domain-containing RNA-binding protein [Oscillospiraceae bacterium]
MERLIGLIVYAVAGRDKGRYFAVVGTEGGYALIADGKSRKLEHPKKKNLSHLRLTGQKTELTGITDRKLRNLLKEFTEQNP